MKIQHEVRDLVLVVEVKEVMKLEEEEVEEDLVDLVTMITEVNSTDYYTDLVIVTTILKGNERRNQRPIAVPSTVLK